VLVGLGFAFSHATANWSVFTAGTIAKLLESAALNFSSASTPALILVAFDRFLWAWPSLRIRALARIAQAARADAASCPATALSRLFFFFGLARRGGLGIGRHAADASWHSVVHPFNVNRSPWPIPTPSRSRRKLPASAPGIVGGNSSFRDFSLLSLQVTPQAARGTPHRPAEYFHFQEGLFRSLASAAPSAKRQRFRPASMSRLALRRGSWPPIVVLTTACLWRRLFASPPPFQAGILGAYCHPRVSACAYSTIFV